MASMREHQEMGYDRGVSLFSPDGLVLQIEYAEKAVKLGSSVIGFVTSEGLVFIADRRIKSKLLVKESFRKIFEIDSNILIAGSGIMSDGRRLIEEAQNIAQKHKIQFEEEVGILSLVKDISNIKQYYSQSGGFRPFGVSLLIGGIEDKTPVMFLTTPSGIYLKYLAFCTGNLSDEINLELEELYKPNMKITGAITLGLKLFKKKLDKEFDIDRFEIISLDLNENLKKYSKKEIEKLI